MKRLIFIVVLMTAGCVKSDDFHKPKTEEMIRNTKSQVELRVRLLGQQGDDIQACRDHGGIAVTTKSEMAWTWEQKLVRCEFPCKTEPAERP